VRVKFLTVVGTLFVLLFSIAPSWASDTPLLTWERGKTQNLVLGSAIGSAPLNIAFTSQSGVSAKFLPSRPNSQGFRVYSINLPVTQPLGVYKIQAYAPNSAQPITVGLVNVISTKVYTLTQIPADLRYILFSLSFITVALAVVRNKKYSELSYSRRIRLDENGSLVHDRRFNRVLYKLYKLRSTQSTNTAQTLFMFLLQRSGQLLHELSPLAWCIAPCFAGMAGFLGALTVPHGLLVIPIAPMAIYSLIGLLDPLSGFFAGLGFGIFEILAGHVTNLHEVLVLVALCITWSLPAIIGELFKFTFEKDKFFKDQEKTVYATLASGIVVVGAFELLQNLIRSASESLWPNRMYYQALSALIGIAFFIKNRLTQRAIDAAIKKNIDLVEERYQTKMLLSKPAVTGLFIFFFFLGFIWTNSWKTAFWVTLEFGLPFLLLILRLENPKIELLSRWKRNIGIEAILVTLVSAGLVWAVTQLPYTNYDRSLIVIFVSLIPALFHAILSNLYEAITVKEMAK